jgi:uncharacterized phage protein (TIGR01671 family)
MRESKFRVWDEKYNCWDKSSLLIYPNEEIKKQGRIIQWFTGLKDKSGKEIYEGDIIELHTAANDKAKDVKDNHCGLYEIYWDRCYKLKTIKPNWFFIPNFESPAADYNIMKVVSNVFEHSNLLK